MQLFKDLDQEKFRKILVFAFLLVGFANVMKWITSAQSIACMNIILSVWAFIYGLHYFANHNHRKGSAMMLILGILVISMFL